MHDGRPVVRAKLGAMGYSTGPYPAKNEPSRYVKLHAKDCMLRTAAVPNIYGFGLVREGIVLLSPSRASYCRLYYTFPYLGKHVTPDGLV